METGRILSVLTGAVNYVIDAFAELFLIDYVALFFLVAPYLCWALVGASALLIVELCVRSFLKTGEATVLSFLYLFGIPGMVAAPLFKKHKKTATEILEDESLFITPIDWSKFHRLAWRRSESYASQRDPLAPTAAQKVDTALIELGVPLTATDDEIQRAYRRLLLQYHPDFFSKAPEATKERARKMTLKIRSAYDTAIGKRVPTSDHCEQAAAPLSRQPAV